MVGYVVYFIIGLIDFIIRFFIGFLLELLDISLGCSNGQQQRIARLSLLLFSMLLHIRFSNGCWELIATVYLLFFEIMLCLTIIYAYIEKLGICAPNQAYVPNPSNPSLGYKFICFCVNLFFLIRIGGWIQSLIRPNAPTYSTWALLYQKYLSNSLQRGWIDALVFIILVNFIICFTEQFDVALGVWKISAITMSLILTILYYSSMYSIITGNHIAGNQLAVNRNRINGCLALCIVSLLASLFLSYYIDQLHIEKIQALLFIIVFLLFATILFIIIDYECMRALENINPTQTVQDIISDYQITFLYGNLPGALGFLILFLVTFFCYYSKLNHAHEDMIIAFVSGGSAMHMLFGNMVAARGLRTG